MKSKTNKQIVFSVNWKSEKRDLRLSEFGADHYF
jgi:hypothetical protein